MPYPSPGTYPSAMLYPGTEHGPVFSGSPVGIGELVLNTFDRNGVMWLLETFDGWGSPSSTAELTQRARGHGATSSEGFLRPRVMTLAGIIDAPDAAKLSAAVDELCAAVTLDEFVFRVSESGRIRHASARRQDDVIVTWIDDVTASFSIQIVAEDPRKYGNLITATTLLPATRGGAAYPVSYPLTYTGVTTTGTVRIINTGNTQAPVWLRVDGPLLTGGWTVTHQGQKKSLTFAPGMSLGPGEFVTVDMEDREVLAQGQAARNGYVTSRGWFSLDPGPNDIAFSAQTYSPTAQLTVTTKPAWS